MRASTLCWGIPAALGSALAVLQACGSSTSSDWSPPAGTGADAAVATAPEAGASSGDSGTTPGASASGDGGGSGGFVFGDSGASSSSSPGCPAGLRCNVTCASGATTISGKVYDPAMKDPLYNVAVYVPSRALDPLPRGVPTGTDACQCSALYKAGAVVSATTDVDGSFTLTNAPVGSDVPLVLQIGKWRRVVHIAVTQCQDNAQPDKSLALLGTVPAGDTDDNMPDIAVSTGSADTLECLMLRIGLPASEYVAGAGTTGHVHLFAGGDPKGTTGGPDGTPEMPGLMGAPESDQNLWDSQGHMMPYDITLLSCEGGEAYNARPDVLEQYLNAGGRVFASHYHYSWFSGPLAAMSPNTYSAPAAWGNNLATWSANGGGAGAPMQLVDGVVDQTLNGSTQAFPKGVALFKWLGLLGALGVNGARPNDLPIYQPRYNANVVPANRVSQPWITTGANGGGNTMYFSFDTPVNAPPSADGGPPSYCGRAVFSDLHVAATSGNGVVTMTQDTPSPPGGCSNVDLSPQEKALEFMLFDLSSCVIPDQVPPTPVLK